MPAAPDPAETEVLQRFLAERDVACPGCGYNLRGSSGTVCPECAVTVTLEALIARPGTRWTALMVALLVAHLVCEIYVTYRYLSLLADERWVSLLHPGSLRIGFAIWRDAVSGVIDAALAVYAVYCGMRAHRRPSVRNANAAIRAVLLMFAFVVLWHVVAMLRLVFR